MRQAAERKRRFERSVRRVAGPSAATSVTMKRSMSEGASTTSGTNSSPTEVAKVPSLPAANKRALVRAGLVGAALVTTARAKAATSGGSDAGLQRAMAAATSLEVTLYIY